MMTNQERFSRRVRGLDIEPHVELERIEKQWSEEKKKKSPVKNQPETAEVDGENGGKSQEDSLEVKNTTSPKVTQRSLFSTKSFSVSEKKPKRREVWSYTKRKRFRKFGRYSLPSVKSQLNKRFLMKKSVEKDTEVQSQPLHVNVTDKEVSKSSKSPPILSQMSPSRHVKAMSPRRLSDVSDKKKDNETTQENEHMPDKTDASKPSAMDVDSGISSSVDSNGDSLDSVEQAKQLEKQKVFAMESEENSTAKGTL